MGRSRREQGHHHRRVIRPHGSAARQQELDMAGVPLPEMSPWKPRSLVIPPNSAKAWLRLALWELWMGMLVCGTLGLGIFLILTSSNHVVAVTDLTNCYGPPPIAVPCERMLYRGGALNAAFSALCG